MIIPTEMNLLIGTLINSYMKNSSMQAISRNVTCSVSYDVMRNRTQTRCSTDMPAWDVFMSTSLETNGRMRQHKLVQSYMTEHSDQDCRVVLRQNRAETTENTKANLTCWTVTGGLHIVTEKMCWQDTSCDVNNAAAAV